MPGEINCLFTKMLIPFMERRVGREGAIAICQAAGRSRDWLMADHNWIPLALANELISLATELTGERDEETFTRHLMEFGMDWKPREERSYLGTYSMGIGDPRTIFQRQTLFQQQIHRWSTFEALEIGRARARFCRTPLPGVQVPRWTCVYSAVSWERFPTNWGLPRAIVTEPECAARGAPCCLFEIRWKTPSLGRRFWIPTGAGAVAMATLVGSIQATGVTLPIVWSPIMVLPVVAGAALGFGLREGRRRQHTQRLLDLQSEEVIYSNNELEKKFRDLDTKIEQLSLLIDLSGAVHATLDPEKIYEQALERLVDRMGYERAHLFLVDASRRVLVAHDMASRDSAATEAFEGLELPLDPEASAVGKVAVSGLPVLVNDVDSATEPVHRALALALTARALVSVPLRVKGRVFGVLTVLSTEPGRFGDGDLELLSAVANHVAIAVDRAESFQTIEDLSRGLEDKVRVRTEQLRAANEELEAAYRNLQATQMQLVQREKMASVGQLVAGVAHELNNPIGFVFSNVTTLEDFVKRLRAMLDAYRTADLPEPERARVKARWDELKIDYALRYLDSMTQGIREGAERARKIVRDLRVFARAQDDVWQAVDLHEELESSLTLLNHLLKDRVTVVRKFGRLASVECVRSQVDQVFLNLLANAAQAIAGEGTITIETRQEDGFAVVSIADTGPGIAPDIIGHIFDPFFTTKPVGEGTGLGLSISYEIVTKHKGEISAGSLPAGGAVFTIRLPVARAT